MTVPARNRVQAESGSGLNQGLSDPRGKDERGQSSGDEPNRWQQLLQLFIGSWVARAIDVAAKLRIADHLKDGPRSAAELAAAAGVVPGPLYRILRALAGVGVFTRQADGRFRLNPLAGLLRGDGPDSLRACAVMIGEEQDRCWNDLHMMVLLGGLERTEAEYRSLLAAHGFRLTRVVPTAGDVSVIEGRPA
jgi:hypothetical protein